MIGTARIIPMIMGRMTSRVAITGFGVVTACGAGKASLDRVLREGSSPVRPMELFDVSTCRSRTAAQVGGLDLPLEDVPGRAWQRLDRASRMLLIAAREAIAQADLLGTGICAPLVMATTGGGMRAGELYHRRVLEGRPSPRSVEWLATYLPHCQATAIQKHLGVEGPIVTLANACASSANALGYAWQMIRSGGAEIVVAAGYDALSELIFAGFDSILAATPTVCRPFDKHRDGMVLGEGAGVFVLEPFERASARGVPILAELRGYGQSIDTLHMTQPNPEGTGAYEAMRAACASAEIAPGEIDAINAHGTATTQNDIMEARAIVALLGAAASRTPVCSTKPITGHTLGAAGAIEAAIAMLSLAGQFVPGNLNLESLDEACPVVVPTKPTPGRLRSILSNSFGFGGLNASLVVGLP